MRNLTLIRPLMRLSVLLGIIMAQTAAAHATVLFSDTFQGNLSEWAIQGSGVIVPDPLDPSENALAFTRLGSGGDLWSPVIPGTGAGTYTLGFYVLGDCGESSGCGAFFGIQTVASGEHWLAADTSWGGLVDQFPDTDTWEWVTFTFTADSAFQVKFEDFVGSPNAYAYTAGGGASVYFKDLQLYTGAVSPSGPELDNVPEPASAALLTPAILGLLALRRSRRAR